MNTHLSASSGAFVWVVAAYMKDGHWHLTEIINGAYAGLAAVTPGSGFIHSASAFCIGLTAGIASYSWCYFVKPRLKIDDALDVAALQGVPGIVGSLAVGIFA